MAKAKTKPVLATRGEIIDQLRREGVGMLGVMNKVNRAALGTNPKQRQVRMPVSGEVYQLLQCPECGSDEHRAAECDNPG